MDGMKARGMMVEVSHVSSTARCSCNPFEGGCAKVIAEININKSLKALSVFGNLYYIMRTGCIE